MSNNKSKNNHLEDILKEFGLDTLEAKTYLALLPLGLTTVLKLSKASEIKRTTLYGVIENLKHKGLCRQEAKGFKKYIVAENPDNLSEVIDLRKQKLEKALPQLSSLYKLKETFSYIKYYEGLNNIKNFYSSILDNIEPNDFYYVISDDEKWIEQDPDFFERFTGKRTRLGIRPKLLLSQSAQAELSRKRQFTDNVEIKLLPKDASIRQNIIILPTQLIFHQVSPPIHAVVVQTKSIIDAQKQLFETLWNQLG